MTKLYYTDPIQAAYMAREFEVELFSELGIKLWLKGNDFCTDVCPNGIYAGCEYVVGKDSYHIFVENDGDIIETTDFRFGEVIVREDGVAFLEGLDRNFTTKRIVLRDNKPFFMPETLSVESE